MNDFSTNESKIPTGFYYTSNNSADHTHSWFTLVMNTLIASMKNGFRVTIFKSEVRMTSNLFFPGLKKVNYGFTLFSGCGGPILALKKENHKNLISKSPRDPLLQRDAHMQLIFFQRNVNIYAKIYHKIHFIYI